MTTPNLTDAERDAREHAEVIAMVQRVRAFLGDAPDDLPFSRTVEDITPWGTTEPREEETALTAADLRAMCDVVALLVAAIPEARTERDTAWRAAIEGMRKPHDPLCMVNAPMGYVPADGAECDCSVADWNAALSALADRMGVKNA